MKVNVRRPGMIPDEARNRFLSAPWRQKFPCFVLCCIPTPSGV